MFRKGVFFCDCFPGLIGVTVLIALSCSGGNVSGSFDCVDDSICDPVASCERVDHQDQCQCPAGYHDANGDGSLCEDLDECGLLTDDCDQRSICVNTSGSYLCECKLGYQADGNDCVDVDECLADTDDCSLPLVCANTLGSFACRCPEGHAGDLCEQCESGYQAQDDGQGGILCVALPIDCLADASVCGSGGMCVSVAEGEDACDCHLGHIGYTCARCDLGFQDHDGDGRCEMSCEGASVECGEHRVCSDERGEIDCVCAAAYFGSACNYCSPGFRDVLGDGNCLPVRCDTADISCPPHSHCVDFGFPVGCACDIGYAGPDCDQCALGFAADGSGVCSLDLDAGKYMFMSTTLEQGDPVLGIVEVETGVFSALALTDHELIELAYDSETETIFGMAFDRYDRGEIFGLDLKTGISEQVGSLSNYHTAKGLAFDQVNRRLVVIGSIGAPRYLIEIDPDTSGLSSREASYPYGDRISLAYDSSDQSVLGVTSDKIYESDQDFSVDRLDLGTATTGRVLEVQPARTLLRVAIGIMASSGQVYIAGNMAPTREAWLEAYCRQVALTLGRDTRDLPAQGSYLIDGYGAEAPLIFSSAAEPELYFYGSKGANTSPPLATILIENDHPDDVVCVVSQEEPIDVFVKSQARFGMLIIVSYRPDTLSLIVPGDFSAPGGIPNIHVHHYTDTPDPLLVPAHAAVVFYGLSKWSNLGLKPAQYDPGLGAEPVFGPLNLSTGEVVLVPLKGLTRFSGGLSGM